jgi:gluconolactonase
VTRRRIGGLALLALLVLLPATPAAAVPDCSPKPRARTLLTGQGLEESIASDGLGRLIYSRSSMNQLWRLDKPGATPKLLADGISKPGGLAFDLDGSLIAGYGDGIAEGQADDGQAGLFRVDPNTGAKKLLTGGMGMANGVAVGPDGAKYGSNDFGGDVDRFLNGKLETDWAKVPTSNGLAVDKAGKYLYVAQTFKSPSIARVEIARPANVTTFVEGPPEDAAAILDGLVRDGADTLYVAANVAGEVWRVGQDRRICALARGLKNPSAVAFGGGGGGQGFGAKNLYVVGFGGELTELADATTTPPPAAPLQPLVVKLSRKTAPLGRTVKVRAEVTIMGVPGSRPAAGATVRLAGRSATTDAKGRASLTVRFARARLVRAQASLAGFRRATAPLDAG